MNWQLVEMMPIELIGVDLQVYREDMGVWVARYCPLAEILSETDVEESDLDEKALFDNDWFAPGYDGLTRLSNDGNPTHYMPLPKPP